MILLVLLDLIEILGFSRPSGIPHWWDKMCAASSGETRNYKFSSRPSLTLGEVGEGLLIIS